jgi:SAM-dependent methyltransferase
LQHGADVTFTDIDPAAIARAQQSFDQIGKGRATGIVSDSYPLPVESNSMTRIIATEVLEHVDDASAFLSELYRVGKPGALYFLTVPDAISEKMQLGLAPPSYFEYPNHIRILDQDQFAKLVIDAGFEIESQKPYGAYWTLWWMFFWNAGVDLQNPSHPLLEAWANTWNELLKTQNPLQTIKALDRHLPKSQVILAKKP